MAQPQPTDGVGYATIALLYATGVLGMLVVSIAVPTLSGIAAEFRLGSPALVGWIMSMPAIAAVLGSLAIGVLVDRRGDRPVMVAGTMLVIVSDAGVVTAHSFAVLLAWRALGGVGYVGMVIAAIAAIGRLTRGTRRRIAFALWSTIIPVSFIIAALVGIASGRGHAGWRIAYMGHAAALAVLGCAILGILPARASTPTPANRLSGLRHTMSHAGPWLLGLSFAGAAFLQTGLVAVLPMLMAARTGADPASIHAFTIPAMSCNIIGAFGFGGLYARRTSARGLGILASMLAAGAAAILLLVPVSLPQALALDCALMLGLGVLVGMWALLPVVATDPASYGATSALITQITLLGVLFGPPALFAAQAFGQGGLAIALGAAAALAGFPVWRKADRGQTIVP